MSDDDHATPLMAFSGSYAAMQSMMFVRDGTIFIRIEPGVPPELYVRHENDWHRLSTLVS